MSTTFLSKDNPTNPRCFVSKSSWGGTVIDLVRIDGDRTRIFGKTLEETRVEHPDAEEMTLDEFIAWKTAKMNSEPLEWEPTTQERYDEQLNVLPPVAWSGHGFLMGEPADTHPQDGHRYHAYRRMPDGSLAVSSRPITVVEWRELGKAP